MCLFDSKTLISRLLGSAAPDVGLKLAAAESPVSESQSSGDHNPRKSQDADTMRRRKIRTAMEQNACENDAEEGTAKI